jgi:two-component system, NtrC family, response regulator AtoC
LSAHIHAKDLFSVDKERVPVSMAMDAAVAISNGVPPESVIFGNSASMRQVQSKLEKLANTNVAVLIEGESGTGKEIIAKLIHRNSPWNKGPFVKVSCPAIPGTLMESELFGYEQGAFTGAHGLKLGRVEMAHRGTLFLDEIAELEQSLQAKLLQLLQDGQFCRIGAQEDKKVEVRIICSTNRVMEQEVASGSFRQDLFYRINVVNIRVPPLRERSSDIPILVDYFLDSFSKQFNRQCKPLSEHVLQVLRRYHWPGNVRELENVMKRYVILGGEDAIETELLSSVESEGREPEFSADGSVSLKKVTRQAIRKMERNIILQVLQTHHWNRKKAARALSISYRALLYKLKEAGIPSRRSSGTNDGNGANGGNFHGGLQERSLG